MNWLNRYRIPVKILFFLLFLGIWTGCGLTYRVLLGVDKTPQWTLHEQLEKDFNKRNIPDSNRYVLDTASYLNYVLSEYNALDKDTNNIDSIEYRFMKRVLKDDLQPTQIRYFDRKGNPIFKLVNCYIDPPIPMSWNVRHCFDTFPPKIDIPELNSNNKNLSFFLGHIKSLDGKAVEMGHLPAADYYVIVFWNKFFKRPSNRLIRTIKKTIRENPEYKIEVLYVNNHNAQLWAHMTSEQRTELSNYLRDLKE